MDLFIGLVIAPLSVLLLALALLWLFGWRHRRPDPAGAHDAGVLVDKAAWAEVVRQLRKVSGRDEPGDASRASGPR